eukprot:364947-Chlamydomonas_euryale.AAC.5
MCGVGHASPFILHHCELGGGCGCTMLTTRVPHSARQMCNRCGVSHTPHVRCMVDVAYPTLRTSDVWRMWRTPHYARQMCGGCGGPRTPHVRCVADVAGPALRSQIATGQAACESAVPPMPFSGAQRQCLRRTRRQARRHLLRRRSRWAHQGRGGAQSVSRTTRRQTRYAARARSRARRPNLQKVCVASRRRLGNWVVSREEINYNQMRACNGSSAAVWPPKLC